MGKKATAPKPEALLKDWGTLNRGLLKLDEKQVEELLATERAGKQRPAHVRRIHQRLNKLRGERERRELAQEVSK